jgi:hypothetical protein
MHGVLLKYTLQNATDHGFSNYGTCETTFRRNLFTLGQKLFPG